VYVFSIPGRTALIRVIVGCKATYVSKVLEVDEEEPKDMIVDYAKKNKATMVVVGTRGSAIVFPFVARKHTLNR